MTSFIFTDEELEVIATIECATELLTETGKDKGTREVEILNALEELYPDLDLKLLARYLDIKGKTAIKLSEKLNELGGGAGFLS